MRLGQCAHWADVHPQQLANLKRLQLGGTAALDNMNALLSAYCEFDGSCLLVVNDEKGKACGFVMQTGIQRGFFQRWDDSLILDWTHSTNNVDYYLGT